MINHHHFKNEPELRKDDALRVIDNASTIIAVLLNFLMFVIFAGLLSIMNIVLYGPRWKFFVVSCLLVFPLYFVLILFLYSGSPLIAAFSPQCILINLFTATVITHLHIPDNRAYKKETRELNGLTNAYLYEVKDVLLDFFS